MGAGMTQRLIDVSLGLASILITGAWCFALVKMVAWLSGWVDSPAWRMMWDQSPRPLACPCRNRDASGQYSRMARDQPGEDQPQSSRRAAPDAGAASTR